MFKNIWLQMLSEPLKLGVMSNLGADFGRMTNKDFLTTLHSI